MLKRHGTYCERRAAFWKRSRCLLLRRVGPGECGSRKTEISHHTRARAHHTANSYRRSMYIHCVCIYREKFSGCAAVSFSFLNHLLLSPSSFILLLRLPRTIVVRFPSHRHQSIVLIVVIIHTATRRGEEDLCVCVCVSDDEDIVVVVSRSEHRGPKGTPGNEF